MLANIPVQINRALNNETTVRELTQISLDFGPNLVAQMQPDTQKALMKWLLENYYWPRIVERRPFEDKWAKLYDMSRAVIKKSDLDIKVGSRLEKELNRNKKSTRTADKITNADIADTLIFDAIDRLVNLNHFVSFKERLPIRFQKPEYYTSATEQPGYSPLDQIYQAGNALLDWNSANQKVYLKHNVVTRQHYTYGTALIHSDFILKVKNTRRRQQGVYKDVPEIHDLGVTFDPISIRRIWFDYRLPIWEMNRQACIFFYDFCHPYEVQTNVYDQVYNPTGFAETQIAMVAKSQGLFNSQETASMMDAFQQRFPNIALTDFAPQEARLNLKWKTYVTAPIDEKGNFAVDGSIPYSKFIVESYGPSLQTGEQTFLRIQKCNYPDDQWPVYGTCLFPDADSGGYSLAIGEVLESYYNQICTIMAEFLENKAWNNDPPTQILTSSPAVNEDINLKGSKILVNSHNDLQRRQGFDGSQSSLQMKQNIKEEGQTSSKAVDAVLGKAMGARTSATEAQNAFQTAMSGITTDINIFNYMAMGGYAERMWRYTGLWMPDSIIYSITGSMGFEIKPADFELRLGLKWDIGSSFIESITRQQNLRYVMESSRMEQTLNRAKVWTDLLTEMKFKNVSELVNDGGLEYQIKRANEEAIRGFRGEQVMVGPDVDHQTAIRIKMAYLEDRNSVWMTSQEFAQNAFSVLVQIQTHQRFLQIQMQQQMLLQQMQSGAEIEDQERQQQLRTKETATTAGQERQQTGA